VSDAPPSSAVILLLGVPTTATDFLGTGCPLLLDLASFYILQFAVTNSAGQWSMSAPIPDLPHLHNTSIGLQAIVLSTGYPQPVVTTNGVKLNFGA
jgi:hypothetical protein